METCRSCALIDLDGLRATMKGIEDSEVRPDRRPRPAPSNRPVAESHPNWSMQTGKVLLSSLIHLIREIINKKCIRLRRGLCSMCIRIGNRVTLRCQKLSPTTHHLVMSSENGDDMAFSRNCFALYPSSSRKRIQSDVLTGNSTPLCPAAASTFYASNQADQ